MNDLLGLPPEELLKRWVNYHLEKQEYPDRITNFSGDVKDGKVYTVLLKSIGGDKCCTTEPLQWDTDRRADQVLSSAQREPVDHYPIRCMSVCLAYLILPLLLRKSNKKHSQHLQSLSNPDTRHSASPK